MNCDANGDCDRSGLFDELDLFIYVVGWIAWNLKNVLLHHLVE